jgi:hypothetical protein
MQEDATATQTSDLFEMANLRRNQTGIDGTIYISTQQVSHGPRVKYYVGRPGQRVPYFSVSIEATPQVVENYLPENVVTRMSPLVIEWVRLNYQALRRGASGFRGLHGLTKRSLPSRLHW